MRKIFGISLLLFTLLFFGCQREVSYFGAGDNPDALPTPAPLTATVQGNVLDETGQPAAGVVVQVGNKTAVTDDNGYFRIADAPLDKKSSLVTATMAGYFKAYRTFSATDGTNRVLIKLIKKALAGSVSATSGGEVVLSNGSKIALPANGLVTVSNGAAYAGTVNVYASYIDPTKADIGQTVPGSFMANDKDGKRVMLASYGMIAVELESAAGESLQIGSGAKATLTTAIPSASQNSAPATIALWSVDEKTGVWKEEGTATKNGAVYVGEVSHFSFWNCDVSTSAVVLSATFKTNENNPLINAAVRIKRTVGEGVMYGYGYTDSLGQVSGYVPGNESLVLELLDECETAFYSQNIATLAQSTNLGSITVSNTGSSIVTIKGKLTDCANAAVTNGYAIITYGYKVSYAAVNAAGDFQTNFTRCASSASTVEIIGVDNVSQQQSNPSSVTVDVPLTDAGTISACGISAEQYFNYTLDGVDYSITGATAPDSLMGYTYNDSLQVGKTTYLLGAESPNFISLQFNHTALATGNYTVTRLSVQNNWDIIPSPSFKVVVTTFPQAAGQFYEGSFNGEFTDRVDKAHTLSGTFRLRQP